MGKILALNGIYAGYGKREVLHGVELEINEGDRVLLIGPNGSGKSTLLKTILGIIKPYSGSVYFEGDDITKLPTYRIVNRGISYLPQTRNIFPSLSVKENLRLSCFFENENYFNKKLEFVLDIFPFLEGRLDDRAGFLSGGQRQALSMGMALMRDFEVLILDEPTAGLSPRATKEILDGLRMVQKRKEFTLIMVEHNVRYLDGMYSRAIVMKEGKIVEETEKVTKETLEKHFF